MLERDAVRAETRAGARGAEGPRTPPAKIRRLDGSQLPDEWTQPLYSSAGEHTVECKFSNSREHECGIMQDLTHLVDVPGLPQAWPRADDPGSGGANTAHLPCGHVFSPCALALHFLVQDMRCPI